MIVQTITIISGAVLLAVFVLVGWNLRRKHADHERGRSSKGVGNGR